MKKVNYIIVLLSSQLFSTEERRAAQQHNVTVHGVPGPEPFTVMCVDEYTTAKQLLDTVSVNATEPSQFRQASTHQNTKCNEPKDRVQLL